MTIGLAAGLTDEEIARVAEGPDADGLVGRRRRSSSAPPTSSTPTAASATPPGRRSRRSGTSQQLIEVCMVVGQYHLVAMTLNSLGVEPESDDFPALPA